MTDITTLSPRELLEAAAKFCGKKIDKSPYNGGGAGNDGFNLLGDAVLDWHNYVTWNPLRKASDRARMCDERAIDIEHDTDIGFAIAWHDGKSRSHSERYADHANDRTLAANYAATRLAARLWIEQQGDAK